MKIKEVKPEIGRCFLDMDGVVVWLDKGLAEYNDVTIKDIDDAGWNNQYWLNVLEQADIKKFFSNLDMETNAKKLLTWFEVRNLPIAFLTRPVRKPNTDACIAGKKIWLVKQGLTSIPVIFERAKEKYAISDNGNPNILIDDHPGNIKSWNEAGGIGILYKNSEFDTVIKKLQTLYGGQK